MFIEIAIVLVGFTLTASSNRQTRARRGVHPICHLVQVDYQQNSIATVRQPPSIRIFYTTDITFEDIKTCRQVYFLFMLSIIIYLVYESLNS